MILGPPPEKQPINGINAGFGHIAVKKTTFNPLNMSPLDKNGIEVGKDFISR